MILQDHSQVISEYILEHQPLIEAPQIAKAPPSLLWESLQLNPGFNLWGPIYDHCKQAPIVSEGPQLSQPNRSCQGYCENLETWAPEVFSLSWGNHVNCSIKSPAIYHVTWENKTQNITVHYIINFNTIYEYVKHYV